MFLTIIVGQFSFSRIQNASVSNNILLQPRLWFLTVFYFLTLPLSYKDNKTSIANAPKTNTPKNWFSLVILLHLYFIVSYFWSPKSEYSKQVIFSLILIIVFLFLCYITLLYDIQNVVKKFLIIFYFTSILFAIGGIIGSKYWATQQGRISFFWGGPNVFVRIVGSGILLSLYFWLKTCKKYWLVPLPLLMIASIMSGSRGGILSLSIVLILSFFILVRRISRIALFLLIALAVILLIAYFMPNSNILQFVEKRYPFSFEDLISEYKRTREPWFSASLEVIKEMPITGIGIGGYNYKKGFLYPHNLILNILAEGGIIGIMLLMILLLYIVFKIKINMLLEARILLLLGTYFLIASMVSGSYYDWRYIWLFYLMYLIESNQCTVVDNSIVNAKKIELSSNISC